VQTRKQRNLPENLFGHFSSPLKEPLFPLPDGWRNDTQYSQSATAVAGFMMFACSHDRGARDLEGPTEAFNTLEFSGGA
jgi:hypothetical protein